MTMNREHTLELLTLLAVIAIVQLPGTDLTAPAKGFGVEQQESAPAIGHRTTAVEAGSPHRLDPVALLQASVPESWRIELPPFEQTDAATLSC